MPDQPDQPDQPGLIHDRMPAILEESEARDCLDGRKNTFAPTPESLWVDDSVSGLVKRKASPERPWESFWRGVSLMVRKASAPLSSQQAGPGVL